MSARDGGVRGGLAGEPCGSSDGSFRGDGAGGRRATAATAAAEARPASHAGSSDGSSHGDGTGRRRTTDADISCMKSHQQTDHICKVMS